MRLWDEASEYVGGLHKEALGGGLASTPSTREQRNTVIVNITTCLPPSVHGLERIRKLTGKRERNSSVTVP